MGTRNPATVQAWIFDRTGVVVIASVVRAQAALLSAAEGAAPKQIRVPTNALQRASPKHDAVREIALRLSRAPHTRTKPTLTTFIALMPKSIPC